MTHTTRILTASLALCLFGAGCSASPSATGPTNVARPPAPAGSMGFGKLPSILPGSGGALAARDSLNVSGAAPTAAVAPAPAEAAGSVGTMMAPSAIVKGRPIPSPYPKPVAVEYTIANDLPTWSTAGDVLRIDPTLPSANDASQFARSAGLPAQALGNSDAISSINLQWKDANAYQWSFDAGTRNVSFWKQTNDVVPPSDAAKQPPQMQNDEAVRIADTFLDTHGFSAIRQTGGAVENAPNYMMPLADGAEDAGSAPSTYPCPVLEAPTVAPDAKSASAGSAVSVPSAPGNVMRPCGWYPQTVTVMYGGMRDGKQVTDAYGNPQRSASITINLLTKEVSGGNLQMDQSADRSSYPLISADAARKRLQSGGQNPVWPWGTESGTIKVKITGVSIVWARYDSWQDGTTKTYFIPALLATGMVDRGIKGQQSEEYRTLVPLVDDASFDETIPPTSVPMMEATPASPPTMMGGAKVK